MRKSCDFHVYRVATIAVAILLLTHTGLQGEITQEDIFRAFRWRNIGPALSPVEAPPDTYGVVLAVGGHPYSGPVSIREDPLMK